MNDDIKYVWSFRNESFFNGAGDGVALADGHIRINQHVQVNGKPGTAHIARPDGMNALHVPRGGCDGTDALHVLFGGTGVDERLKSGADNLESGLIDEKGDGHGADAVQEGPTGIDGSPGHSHGNGH